MKRYKTVMLPLDVPKGNFCWRGCGAERDFDSPICGHFNNEASVECTMQLGQIIVDGKGRYLKPKTGLRLKKQNESPPGGRAPRGTTNACSRLVVGLLRR